jgi:lipoprotein-anchoring transpeptidase ErfK/SrfK
VTYALLFDNRGYYIHDAPWRTDYGPGSNAKPGTPGQDLTGSHGCINVPLPIAKQLYDWAPTGTAVQVVP